jgi:hypothetical protein
MPDVGALAGGMVPKPAQGTKSLGKTLGGLFGK